MRFQTRNVDIEYLKKYIKKLEPLLTAKKRIVNLLKNQNLGVYNMLHGQISINKVTHQKCICFRSKFHALCSNNQSEKQKIKILNQTGGFMQLLLPSIVTGVFELIGSLVGRRN